MRKNTHKFTFKLYFSYQHSTRFRREPFSAQSYMNVDRKEKFKTYFGPLDGAICSLPGQKSLFGMLLLLLILTLQLESTLKMTDCNITGIQKIMSTCT